MSKNGINTIDSLWIEAGGTYLNKIYRKVDNSLVYENKGTWKNSKGSIVFEGFFLDEDAIYSKETSSHDKSLITTSLRLERKSGKTIIRHSIKDNVYLEKNE